MRLLIVEDEPDLLSSLGEALREDGYAVDEARDGEDGLAKALRHDYDAIVLDVMLPGMRAMEEQGERTDSVFEKLVLQRLISAGYRVHPQWPVGARRIDLVVEGKTRRLAGMARTETAKSKSARTKARN